MDLHAPMAGTVSAVPARVGDTVPAGRPLIVLEMMKMEEPVSADVDVVVEDLRVAIGDTVARGQVLARVSPVSPPEPDATAGVAPAPAHVAPATDLTERADLLDLRNRRAATADDARPEAMARRRASGHRSARDNLADLLDPGSLVEWGALTVAAQSARRSAQELLARTPGDGVIAGIGTVDGAPVAVLSYDYTVLAGTQGTRGHRKMDRLFALAEQLGLPVVMEATGGGGRPGDTDYPVVSGLDVPSFAAFARLSGRVPLVALVTGPCFAGNAALAGCCDVLIATRDATLGMGGPAMIEGGGLGVVSAAEVGPAPALAEAGVVDVLVDDDAAAVAVARRYLGLVAPRRDAPGAAAAPPAVAVADQTLLRSLVPAERSRIYDARRVLDTLADPGSVLELGAHHAPGMITALARLEGHPVAVLQNDPAVNGGAIDPEGARKASRFLQLADAHGVAVLFLVDTPGFLVGPAVELRAAVRRCAGMFVAGAALEVPVVTVVLRKGYGLGAQAMAAGSFRSPLATLSWPGGEFGGMGPQGAVRLALRHELAALEEPERSRVEREAIALVLHRGRALSMAEHLEIDDVIDPAETRARVGALLAAAPPRAAGARAWRPIPTW